MSPQEGILPATSPMATLDLDAEEAVECQHRRRRRCHQGRGKGHDGAAAAVAKCTKATKKTLRKTVTSGAN